MKCDCDPRAVRVQEYQRTAGIMVPDHIELFFNNPENERRRFVPIDVCLISEIWDLWRCGIKTVGSCCGHNQAPAYIQVATEHAKEMLALGYALVDEEKCTFEPKQSV